MKQQIQQALAQVTATVKETFTDLGDSAKERAIGYIDSWLDVFPELESMGLEINNFGISLGILPELEVELTGQPGVFDDGKLEELRLKYEDNRKVGLVLKAIHTTKLAYDRVGKKEISDQVFVKIRVKVPPEIGVYFGRPFIP